MPADRVRAIMGITAAPGPDGGLVLTAPGLPDLAIAAPAQAHGKVPIDLYDLGSALAAGRPPTAGVSRALDRPPAPGVAGRPKPAAGGGGERRAGR